MEAASSSPALPRATSSTFAHPKTLLPLLSQTSLAGHHSRDSAAFTCGLNQRAGGFSLQPPGQGSSCCPRQAANFTYIKAPSSPKGCGAGGSLGRHSGVRVVKATKRRDEEGSEVPLSPRRSVSSWKHIPKLSGVGRQCGWVPGAIFRLVVMSQGWRSAAPSLVTQAHSSSVLSHQRSLGSPGTCLK